MTWEYIMLSRFDTIDLNKYGADGWELVNIVAFRDGSVAAWLKRPKQDKPSLRTATEGRSSDKIAKLPEDVNG